MPALVGSRSALKSRMTIPIVLGVAWNTGAFCGMRRKTRFTSGTAFVEDMTLAASMKLLAKSGLIGFRSFA